MTEHWTRLRVYKGGHVSARTRGIMRLNGLLAVVSGSPDECGEWPYGTHEPGH